MAFPFTNMNANKSHVEAAILEYLVRNILVLDILGKGGQARCSLLQTDCQHHLLYYIRCLHTLLSAAMCYTSEGRWMYLFLPELCSHPPSFHVETLTLSLLAALFHLPGSPAANYHIYREKPAMILAGIPTPQLRHQRNDHCKSHSCQPFMQAQSWLSRRPWCDCEGCPVYWRVQSQIWLEII